jgi:hypothetical protein
MTVLYYVSVNDEKKLIEIKKIIFYFICLSGRPKWQG